MQALLKAAVAKLQAAGIKKLVESADELPDSQMRMVK